MIPLKRRAYFVTVSEQLINDFPAIIFEIGKQYVYIAAYDVPVNGFKYTLSLRNLVKKIREIEYMEGSNAKLIHDMGYEGLARRIRLNLRTLQHLY